MVGPAAAESQVLLSLCLLENADEVRMCAQQEKVLQSFWAVSCPSFSLFQTLRRVFPEPVNPEKILSGLRRMKCFDLRYRLVLGSPLSDR